MEQPALTQHWTTSVMARQIERQVAEAARYGITVLPITVGGNSKVVVYGVQNRGVLLARCTTLADAAEVAIALAIYRRR